jgi:hypothetical protein
LDPPGVTLLRGEFHIELPQNGICGPHRLTTFLGPNDICLVSTTEFSTDILGVTLQDSPINLLCPNFNWTS